MGVKIKNHRAIFLFLISLLLAGCGDPAPVRHNGRVKPFDSYARETLRLVAGSEGWQGRSAAAVIRDLSDHPSKINGFEWIRIESAELKKSLGLSGERRYFSLSETDARLEKIGSLVRSAKAKRDSDLRPSKLEQKAELLYAQIDAVEKLGRGEAFTPAPGESLTRAGIELLANRAKPFERAAFFYFLAFFLLTLFKKNPILKKIGWVALGGAFLFHTAGIAARVAILARPPVSNMYESMIFMNWVLIVFAAAFSALRKNLLALVAGSAASGLVMVYANLLPLDPGLDVLVPVLRSNYWLSIHVMTVVSSYGAFGLAMALGNRHLFCEAFGKLTGVSEKESADLVYRVIQLGPLLIGTGTVLGGVWANESWGRFWGWDPKETWALITFLTYLIVVHLKFAKKISDFYLALAAVLGFSVVLMTWYGVNFVLGRGLHSYGQGTGGMRWVVYYLVGQAAFLGFISIRKFSRQSRRA
ncbi:MAG: cytochrome c biogenesis protein CcsA [Candidatus Omnitrophica bacterium]|nr:cytochrome c biogenesis protein CcsA [Candidatus Omnitrophota bacterium]